MNTPISPPNDFFSFSSALCCVLDNDGFIIQVNAAWEKRLGIACNTLLGRHFLSGLHPEDQATGHDLLQRLRTESLSEISFILRWQDEEDYLWLQWEWSVKRLDSEKVQFYGVATDLSNQKYTEKALFDSQKRYELAVRGSNHGLWDWNLITNEIYLSSRWKNILGYQENEIANYLDEWCRFVHPDDFSEMWATLENYLDKRAPYYESVYRMRHKDGHYIWVLARAAALWDTTDSPYRMVGTYVNITEQIILGHKLKDTVAELEAILDNSMVGIVYCKNGIMIRANHKLETLLEFEADELCGLPFSTLYPEQQDCHFLEERAYPLLASGGEYDAGHLMQTKKGKVLWCRLTGKAIDQRDFDKGVIWMIEDITLYQQAELNLRLAAAVFETTVDGILVTDLQTKIQRVNSAFSRITGYSAEEVYGKKTNILASKRHDAAFYQAMWESIANTGHWQGEIWNRKKTGELYVAWLSISVINDEHKQPLQYMAILSDISRLQEDIENARYLASYDSLTRLPNRLLFHDNLQQAQIWARRHNTWFALLFIDLDGFKAVNDQLGHAVGDQLLQMVATALQKVVRQSDTVARLGGDEFTVILNNVKKQEDVSKIATKIIRSIQHPFEIEGHPVRISASIGITFYPRGGTDPTVLLKQADTAMYEAKRLGKGGFCYYEDILS